MAIHHLPPGLFACTFSKYSYYIAQRNFIVSIFMHFNNQAAVHSTQSFSFYLCKTRLPNFLYLTLSTNEFYALLDYE